MSDIQTDSQVENQVDTLLTSDSINENQDNAGMNPIEEIFKKDEEENTNENQDQIPKDDGIPEKYEYTFDDGVVVDPEMLDELSSVAKEIGLSQENAQKIANLAPKINQMIYQKQLSQIKNLEKQWADEIKNHPVLGGQKQNENIATAKKAFDAILSSPSASKEFKSNFKNYLSSFDAEKNPSGTGLGNNPLMLEAFYHLGKALSEDTIIGGKRATTEKSLGEIIFGKGE